MFFRFVFLVALSLASSVAVADRVYRWVDENGVTQFSDYPRDRHSKPIEIREKNSAFSLKRHNRALREEVPELGPGANAEYHLRQEERIAREKREQARKCRRYENRLESINSSLRSGGYSSSYRNSLRAERREIRAKKSRECTLN